MYTKIETIHEYMRTMASNINFYIEHDKKKEEEIQANIKKRE